MLAGYIATLVAFVAAEVVSLEIMVERVYRPAIADILSTSVNLPAAIVFYLIFPVGLTIFAVLPTVQNQSAGNAAVLGGLFGFFAYATYDLTNQDVAQLVDAFDRHRPRLGLCARRIRRDDRPSRGEPILADLATRLCLENSCGRRACARSGSA